MCSKTWMKWTTVNHDVRCSVLPITVTDMWLTTWSVWTTRDANCSQRIHARCLHLHGLHQQTNAKDRKSLAHGTCNHGDRNRMLSLKTFFSWGSTFLVHLFFHLEWQVPFICLLFKLCDSRFGKIKMYFMMSFPLSLCVVLICGGSNVLVNRSTKKCLPRWQFSPLFFIMSMSKENKVCLTVILLSVYWSWNSHSVRGGLAARQGERSNWKYPQI